MAPCRGDSNAQRQLPSLTRLTSAHGMAGTPEAPHLARRRGHAHLTFKGIWGLAGSLVSLRVAAGRESTGKRGSALPLRAGTGLAGGATVTRCRSIAPSAAAPRSIIIINAGAALGVREEEHALFGVLCAELFVVGAGDAVPRPGGAAVVAAPLGDDVDHAILLVFGAELRLFGAGNTKTRVLGAAVIGAHLADGVHHPVRLVLRAEFRLLAPLRAIDRVPAATVVGALRVLDIHHAVLLVLRVELCLLAAGDTEAWLSCATGVAARPVFDIHHAVPLVFGAELAFLVPATP